MEGVVAGLTIKRHGTDREGSDFEHVVAITADQQKSQLTTNRKLAEGGGGGNRTPVLMPLGDGFYGRSRVDCFSLWSAQRTRPSSASL